MKMLSIVIMILLAGFAPLATAGTITLTPTNQQGVVGSAINSGGFFVWPDTTGLFGSNAWVADFSLNAGGSGYSDAGLVLFNGGGLKLGQLKQVSVVSTGAPLAVNLWLDTGGDGKFFAYGGLSGYELTGLAGDTYASCGAPTFNSSSTCDIFAGNGAGSQKTLGQLQLGNVLGIDSNTPAALWVGIVGSGQWSNAEISSISITTAGGQVPEPASMLLMGTGFVGLALISRRRWRKQ